jgi:hypothetical protein
MANIDTQKEYFDSETREILETIYRVWDELPKDIREGSHMKDKSAVRKTLRTYLNGMKKDKDGDYFRLVKYYKSKLLRSLGIGRYYAKNSLSFQCFQRAIRHTCLNKLYYDIDMKNAHLSILVQYCEKHNYQCKEVKKSVMKNEDYLKDIMKAHNCDRDHAKKMKLSVSYGSDKPINTKWYIPFKKEIDHIHKKMIKDKENKDILEILKDKEIEEEDFDEYYNIEGKLCGQLMCKIENEILMACIAYLKKHEINTKKLVLCFDGFAILKDLFEPSEKNLEEMAQYAFKKTGYLMTFVSKPMNEIIDLTKFKQDKVEEEIIDDDYEACKILLEKMKSKIYNCNGETYVCNEDHVWTNNKVEVERMITLNCVNLNIKKNSNKICPYSKSVAGIKNMLILVKNMCEQDNHLLETIRLNCKNKLFFKNGVYDFVKKEFRKETDEDMTSIRINREYNNTEDKEAKIYVENILNDIFEKEKHDIMTNNTKNVLEHVARAISGNIQDKDYVMVQGLRNSGKGVFSDMLINAFGSYIGATLTNNFMFQGSKSHQDEALNRKWLLPHIHTRILIGNEMPTDQNSQAMIDGVLIKSLSSGGDIQKCRGLYQSEISFVPQFRIFMFYNTIPEICPVDALQTCSLFYMPNQYIRKSEYDMKVKSGEHIDKYMKIADDNIKDKLKEGKLIDAFTKIIIEHYKDHSVENTEKAKMSIMDYRMDMKDEKLIFNETFDFSNTKSFTSSTEIHNQLKRSLPNISLQQIKSYLSNNIGLEYTIRKINKIRVRGYVGVQLKQGSIFDDDQAICE